MRARKEMTKLLEFSVVLPAYGGSLRRTPSATTDTVKLVVTAHSLLIGVPCVPRVAVALFWDRRLCIGCLRLGNFFRRRTLFQYLRLSKKG